LTEGKFSAACCQKIKLATPVHRATKVNRRPGTVGFAAPLAKVGRSTINRQSKFLRSCERFRYADSKPIISICIKIPMARRMALAMTRCLDAMTHLKRVGKVR